MASLRQLKKQMVHAAVVENVELIHNRLPLRLPASPPAAPRRRQSLRIVLLAMVLLVTGVGAAAVWSNPPARSALALWTQQVVQGAKTRIAALTAGEPSDSAVDHGLLASSNGEVPAWEPETVVVLNPESTSSMHFDQPPDRVDRRVFPLGLRTIVLDPGHGGANYGTAKGDLREKDLTLDIAERLRTLLLGSGFEVVMTRSRDIDVELDERVEIANRASGDLFVSIHVNWLGRAGGGVETFYLGTSDDPRIVELTAKENVDSGYTLKDFRNLLDQLYVDVRRDESRNAARSVQRAMHSSLSEVSPKLRDRGVKTAPFVVLIGTEMPALLAEVSSLSDTEEARLLRDNGYRQRIAEALHAGVLGYAETLVPESEAARVASP